MSRVFSDEGVKLVWLPTIPTNMAAITPTIAAAGKDWSDFAVVGMTDFLQAASDTIDQKRYSDRGKVQNLTLKNADGKATLYRDRDEDGTLTEDDPVADLSERQIGCVLKRKGVPESVAWAAGQDYEYFTFQADAIRTINDADGGYEMVEVNFAFKGDVGMGVVVAA